MRGARGCERCKEMFKGMWECEQRCNEMQGGARRCNERWKGMQEVQGDSGVQRDVRGARKCARRCNRCK